MENNKDMKIIINNDTLEQHLAGSCHFSCGYCYAESIARLYMNTVLPWTPTSILSRDKMAVIMYKHDYAVFAIDFLVEVVEGVLTGEVKGFRVNHKGVLRNFEFTGTLEDAFDYWMSLDPEYSDETSIVVYFNGQLWRVKDCSPHEHPSYTEKECAIEYGVSCSKESGRGLIVYEAVYKGDN